MRLERRTLLRSLVVVGSAGMAGCFGGDGDTTGTEPDDGNGDSPVGSPRTSPTPDTTPTYTTVCGVCVDRPDLIVADETTAETTAASTVTAAATFRNPYPFAVEDVEITLQPPSGEWSVAGDPVTVERVPAEAEREVSWEVTVPDVDPDAYTLTTVTTIRGPGTDYTVRTNRIEIRVTEP
jgi:hypothetical protein